MVDLTDWRVMMQKNQKSVRRLQQGHQANAPSVAQSSDGEIAFNPIATVWDSVESLLL